MTVEYTFEKVDYVGTHSAYKDLFKFMCDKGYTYHDFEDYEEAEKKCVYDPRRGTTCPELEALEKVVDDFISKLELKGMMLLIIYPENNIDEEGKHTKEYRNRYIYDINASLNDIINRENYIFAAINY